MHVVRHIIMVHLGTGNYLFINFHLVKNIIYVFVCPLQHERETNQ